MALRPMLVGSMALVLMGWVAGAHAQDAATPTTISIALSEFKITPSTIALQPNHPYTFHLTNLGGSGHSFSAKAFFKAVTAAPASTEAVADGTIEVPKVGAVDVTFVTGQAGEFEMHCTHPLHSTFGMKGKIVVGP